MAKDKGYYVKEMCRLNSDGTLVKKSYALAHPNLTTIEHRKVLRKK